MELSLAKLRAEEKRLNILLNFYKCSSTEKKFIGKMLKKIWEELEARNKNKDGIDK